MPDMREGVVWHVVRYEAFHKEEWDAFVSVSRNGTFLFMRGYMDYHAERFSDHSLMIYHKGKLCALLPAHVDGDVYCSHRGLTYGGFITDKEMKAGMMMELFDRVLCYLRSELHVSRFVYSPIPYIYSNVPSQEDLYALFRHGARLLGRKISTVITASAGIPFTEPKRRNVRRAGREELTVCCDDGFRDFWNVLEDNLDTRHHVKPVHTLEEMLLLYGRFSSRIRLYRVCDRDSRTLAGCVIYETGQVAHVQYIGSTSEGREKRAVDFLFHHLVHDVYAGIPYFDLGTSVEEGGRVLNEGLIYQKESFGGRAVVYDTYELDL